MLHELPLQPYYAGGRAANYERYFVPAVAAPLAAELVDLADLRPGERVLDVACGTGAVARLAAERVGGLGVIGVDVDREMLDIARLAVADEAIEWCEASAESLPLADGTVDVVLCQMGLQFLPDRLAGLRELRRVLDHGGRIVLNVPGPMPPLFAALERALRRQLGPEAAGFLTVVFGLHGAGEMCRLLDAAGFGQVQARSDRMSLRLPAAEDFLWQYVYSTPLAAAAADLDDARRAALQEEFVTESNPFAMDGGLVLELRVTSATARAA
jgi:SAM-dependent methyltransferase